jgi:hypothetical protein
MSLTKYSVGDIGKRRNMGFSGFFRVSGFGGFGGKVGGNPRKMGVCLGFNWGVWVGKGKTLGRSVWAFLLFSRKLGFSGFLGVCGEDLTKWSVSSQTDILSAIVSHVYDFIVSD